MSGPLLREWLSAVAAVSWQLVHSPSTWKDPDLKTSMNIPVSLSLCWFCLTYPTSTLGGDWVANDSTSAVTASPVSSEASIGNPTVAKELIIAPEEILESRVHDLGDRKITTEKISPIELPPIPAPPPPPDPLDPAVHARMQALREKHAHTAFVLIGATVYNSTAFADGPRTRVTLRGKNGEVVTCWSSADWDLFTGTGSFMDSSGRAYALIMSHSSLDMDRWTEFVARRGGTFQPPVIPSIPAGKATFVVTDGAPSPDSLAALGALHDFYNGELETLKSRRKAMHAEQLAREEELRANPPQPKDIVIRHWRIDKAGQNGATAKPALTR